MKQLPNFRRWKYRILSLLSIIVLGATNSYADTYTDNCIKYEKDGFTYFIFFESTEPHAWIGKIPNQETVTFPATVTYEGKTYPITQLGGRVYCKSKPYSDNNNHYFIDGDQVKNLYFTNICKYYTYYSSGLSLNKETVTCHVPDSLYSKAIVNLSKSKIISANGMYALPSSLFPAGYSDGRPTFKSFYDVNLDGKLDAIGIAYLDGKYYNMIANTNGEVLQKVSSDFQGATSFISLDNTGMIYGLYQSTYSQWPSTIRPCNDLSKIINLPYSGLIGDLNNDGLADIVDIPSSQKDYISFDAYIRQKDGSYLKQVLEITTDTTDLKNWVLSNYTPSGSGIGSLGDGMFVKSKEHSFDNSWGEDGNTTKSKASTRSIASDADGIGSNWKGIAYDYIKDMNGDGLQDIVTSSYIYYNLGNNKFFRSAHVGNIYPADINGDGITDYVDFGNGKVNLYISNADGSIGTGKTLFENNALQNVFFGDFDKDGDVDILFFIPTDDVTYLVFYRNDGNGSFKRKETYIDGKYSSLICKDFDGDGLYEVAANQDANEFLIKCDLKKVEATVTPIETPNESTPYNSSYGYTGLLTIGDFNNDGITEYAYPTTASSSSTQAPSYSFGTIPAVQKNTCPNKMTKPSVSFNAETGKLKITWDKGSDAQTSACDLMYELRIGTQPGKGDILYANSLSDGRRRTLLDSNMGKAQSYLLDASRLDFGKYYISVQAIDAGGLGGAWSDETVYDHKLITPIMETVSPITTTADTLQVSVRNAKADAKYTWYVEQGSIIEQSTNGDVAKIQFHGAGKLNLYVQMSYNNNTYKSTEKVIEVSPFKKGENYISSRNNYYTLLDVNQDGVPEIYDSYKNKNGLFNVDKDGNRTSIRKSYNSDLSGYMTPYDFNNDGYPDFMLNRSSNNMYINSGEQDNEFEYSSDDLARFHYGDIIDYNNDGRYDISEGDKYYYYQHQGPSKFFSWMRDFNENGGHYGFWDVNRDGAWDIYRDKNGYRRYRVFIKQPNANADIKYEEKQFIPDNMTQDYLYLHAVEDLNNDGYPDYILHNRERDEYIVIKGKPMDEWPCTEKVMQFSDSYKLGMDFDNNGYKDFYSKEDFLLVQPDFKYIKVSRSGYTSSYNSYDPDDFKETTWQPLTKDSYPNGLLSTIKNEAPAAPTNVRAYMTENGLQLTWDDAKDDHTPWAQMRYNVSVKYKNKKVGEEDAFLVSPLNGLNDEATICSNVYYRKATKMLIPTSVLTSGKTYEVQIQAIDLMGAHSPMSKPIEVTVNTEGYIKVAHKYVKTNQTCDIEFAGTQASTYKLDANDAVFKDKGNGKYTVSWSEAGTKNITMTVDGKVFNTVVTVISEEDLHLNFPAKVLRNAPITIEVPEIFFSQDVKNTTIMGTYKYDYNPNKKPRTATFTFNTAGINEVSAGINYEGDNDSWIIYNTNVNVVDEEMPTPQITGVVAVGNNYQVRWDTNMPSVINRVEISRETNQLNQFEILDTIAVNAGIYTDLQSNTQVQSQRYRIRLLANNNLQVSEYSEIHKPMHVMIYNGANKGYHLVWNAYEGMEVESYRILRGTSANDVKQIAQVAGSQQSYTDITTQSGTYYYAVAFTPVSVNAQSAKAARSSANINVLSNVISTVEAKDMVEGSSIQIRVLEGITSMNYPTNELHLMATILPINATCTNVTWSIVQGENIAQISQNGLLTAKDGEGTVIVRATATDGSGVFGEISINCRCMTYATSIDLICPTTTMKVGEQIKLTTQFTPSYAYNRISWSSNNPYVAKVDDKGVVTAVGAGSVTITATTNDGQYLFAKAYLTVTAATAIREIDSSDNTTVIYYDLEGRKIQTPVKGHLYITNKGKKVVF